MASSHHARTPEGRLAGLAKVEDWSKSSAGRKGARKSPWRFGALHHSAPPPRRKPSLRNIR